MSLTQECHLNQHMLNNNNNNNCAHQTVENSLLLIHVHPTPRTKTGWLPHLGSGGGTNLPHANTAGYGRSAAEVEYHLGWFPAECSRQSNWSAAKETQCLRSYTRRSHRTVVLTQLVACFMTAINVLSQWHFWHCRTVANCRNKTCKFHKLA